MAIARFQITLPNIIDLSRISNHNWRFIGFAPVDDVPKPPKAKINKTGFAGVSRVHYRYLAVSTVGGKHKYLGTFPTAEAAYTAYV
jgi:hypothetical protein